jgi:hypothetical protein
MDTTQTLLDLSRAVDALTGAKAVVTAAQARVTDLGLTALEAARDDDDARAAIASALYWTALDLPVRRISEVVGSDDQVRALAGPGPVLPPCTSCGDSRRARTRTELKAPPGECADCRAARQRRELAAWRREEDERVERRDLGRWEEHIRHRHAADAEDEAEERRLRTVWSQLPRWSCGCGEERYRSSGFW